jgi:hypothetical protein
MATPPLRDASSASNISGKAPGEQLQTTFMKRELALKTREIVSSTSVLAKQISIGYGAQDVCSLCLNLTMPVRLCQQKTSAFANENIREFFSFLPHSSAFVGQKLKDMLFQILAKSAKEAQGIEAPLEATSKVNHL